MPNELEALIASIDTLRNGTLRPYPKLRAKVRRVATKTPRTQHGEWRTNREARWSIDERSPHFAAEVDCRRIELKLLAQVFEFTSAPTPTEAEAAVLRAVLGTDPVAGSYRCPLSGRNLDFRVLVDSTDWRPRHGRSQFAVGHLQPLAHGTARGRHVAGNITWVHEQGNRIQGNLSLEEATDEVFRVADFHRRRRGLGWREIEGIAERPPAPDDLAAPDQPATEDA
jgi:hypothetical protein